MAMVAYDTQNNLLHPWSTLSISQKQRSEVEQVKTHSKSIVYHVKIIFCKYAVSYNYGSLHFHAIGQTHYTYPCKHTLTVLVKLTRDPNNS